MPAPSDRSGLYEGSRYRMQQRKSTLAGADGGPRCSPRCGRPASVTPQLIDPGGKLVPIEPQVFPELDVRDAVGARALIQPAHRHSREIRGFLDCQPCHDGVPGEATFPPRRLMLESHERRRSTTKANGLPFREGTPRRLHRGAKVHPIGGSRQLATERGRTAVNEAPPCRRGSPLDCCSLPRSCSIGAGRFRARNRGNAAQPCQPPHTMTPIPTRTMATPARSHMVTAIRSTRHSQSRATLTYTPP